MKILISHQKENTRETVVWPEKQSAICIQNSLVNVKLNKHASNHHLNLIHCQVTKYSVGAELELIHHYRAVFGILPEKQKNSNATIYYWPEQEENRMRIPCNNPNFLMVCLDKFFLDYIVDNHYIIDDYFKKHIEFCQTYQRNLYNPFVQIITLIAERIIARKKSGFLEELMVVAAIHEMLYYFFKGMRSACGIGLGVTSLVSDEDRLREALKILQTQFKDPPTIPQLARMVGLNEFKLKKGFKSLFNQTIFGYLLELRMQMAKDLVRQTGISMGEIAETLGYAYPHHFSAAFKKYYGVLPLKMRGERNGKVIK